MSCAWTAAQHHTANSHDVCTQEPDVLLLDEPTNHLDLDAVEWLEGYLRKQVGRLTCCQEVLLAMVPRGPPVSEQPGLCCTCACML